MATLDKNLALIRLAESARTDFGRVDFADQNDAQKVFSSIWELEAQLNSGGFDAYLRYSDSNVIAYAPIALRSVGATQCAAIAERALHLFGLLPSTRAARENALDALDSDAVFNALDAEVLAYSEDLTELLFAFVAKRSETLAPYSSCGEVEVERSPPSRRAPIDLGVATRYRYARSDSCTPCVSLRRRPNLERKGVGVPRGALGPVP